MTRNLGSGCVTALIGLVGSMGDIVGLATGHHFVYHQTMSVEMADASIARVAAAIAELDGARMLSSLMDGRARTSTELAVIAEVSPSTASVHLAKLKQMELVKVVAQGKHRYYSLDD